MKKLISLLMAAVMLLSLCACGAKSAEEVGPSAEEELYNKYADLITSLENEDYESAVMYIYNMYEDQQTAIEEDPEAAAAAEAAEALEKQYATAMNALANYIANDGSYMSFGYEDENGAWVNEDYEYHAAAAKLYEVFTALGDYEMAPEILTHFTIVPDVLLSRTTVEFNAFGEESWTDVCYFWHNEQGQLVSEGAYSRINYTYDANGNMVEQKSVSHDTTNWVMTYSYDQSGNLMETEQLDSYGNTTTVRYSYDENGVIISREEQNNDNSPKTMEYVYDEAGYLIAVNEVSDWSYETWEYTNDADGRVIEMVEGWKNINDAGEYVFDEYAEYYTYTYEGDRLVFETMTDNNGKEETTYNYGDLYNFEYESIVMPEEYQW